MKVKTRVLQGMAVLVIMVLLLIDIDTAKSGAADGLQLCIQSVIPSLFPFIFLSILLTSSLYGTAVSVLSPLSKLGIVPKGGESILLMALLGGYPVGAQAVHSAWADGTLDTETARRLLGFCNNAGPSFIFGILSNMFENKTAVWLLWLLHIVSALIVGGFLSAKNTCTLKVNPGTPLSATNALKRATAAMSGICGWIVIIRTFQSFAAKYLLSNASPAANTIFSGIVELTNGCLLLPLIANESTRFIIASCLLSLGGLCVYLQTRAVTGKLGTGMYIKGKILQTLISLILSCITVTVLY